MIWVGFSRWIVWDLALLFFPVLFGGGGWLLRSNSVLPLFMLQAHQELLSHEHQLGNGQK